MIFLLKEFQSSTGLPLKCSIILLAELICDFRLKINSSISNTERCKSLLILFR